MRSTAYGAPYVDRGAIDQMMEQKRAIEKQLAELDIELHKRALRKREMGRVRAERPFAQFPLSARSQWGAPSARG